MTMSQGNSKRSEDGEADGILKLYSYLFLLINISFGLGVVFNWAGVTCNVYKVLYSWPNKTIDLKT